MPQAGLLKRRISVWGDSMVDHIYLPPLQQNFVNVLRDLTGRAVQMRGVGGEPSLATRTRFEAEPHAWIDVTLIWTGANDFSNPPYWAADVINIRNNITAIVNHLTSIGNGSFYVISIINGFGVAEDSPFPHLMNAANARQGLNDEFQALWGDRFIDVKSMLNAQDPTELKAVSGNYLPYVVREPVDQQTHVNVVGYKLVAKMIYDRIVLLGD